METWSKIVSCATLSSELQKECFIMHVVGGYDYLFHPADPFFFVCAIRFYEPLEPLGEGSMGSVAKVRKRTEVIGGSARPKYRKVHAQPKSPFRWWLLRFCPMQRTTSDASHVSGQRNGNPPSRQPQPSNCFTLFCCPAGPKPNSLLLDPILEDDGPESEDDEKERNLHPISWWRRFLFGSTGGDNNSSHSSAGGESKQRATFTTKDSLLSDTNNSEDPLTKEDYEAIDQQVRKVLQHSTSSIITYGHKAVIYALKSIHLDRVSSKDFMTELKNEVAILKELDHPHIVKCFETFNYNKSLFLVLELCSGGDLYSRDPYSEQSACTIIRSILSAVAFMHSKRITHRGKQLTEEPC
jgi:serine/threonine protein kinase